MYMFLPGPYYKLVRNGRGNVYRSMINVPANLGTVVVSPENMW